MNAFKSKKTKEAEAEKRKQDYAGKVPATARM
jgi:hypothetical protein